MAELASTYVVQNRDSQEELDRLIVLDQMMTRSMGGVLPEQRDPTQFHRVLDIGCGSGGWVIDTAQAYPQMKVYGADISSTIIKHARERAEEQQLAKERVEFLVMDALRMLEFPDGFFDLINFRFGVSFMRQWDWPKMFSEMRRVLKIGSTVRIVEGEADVKSASAAFSSYYVLARRAFFRSGHLFKEEPLGLIDDLPSLLIRHGFQNVQSREALVEYRTGTETGDAFMENYKLAFHTFRPFLYRYGCMPDDYDAICLQALEDMQQVGFVATLGLYTLWAINPAQTKAGLIQREEPR
jgi:ubiquinone/menaquinone biosynthesis C-methylase UbiE